jgi:hypothetical protein
MRMDADVLPPPTRSRRRVRWWWILVGVVAIFLVTRVIALIVVSAEDDPPPVTNNAAEVQREHIINAVADGHLPPVALRIYPWNGRVDPNFVDGPNYGKDVVHVRGADGPKLQWDLDGDGRISRAERTITEQELYQASFRWRSR